MQPASITGPVMPLLFEELRRAGVRGCAAGPWSGAALPLSEFVRTLELASAGAARPGLLWRCGQKLADEALETLIPATRGVNELAQALPLVAASMALLQTESSFELRVHGSLIVFEYRVLEPAIWPRARDAEFTLGFLDGVVRRFVPRDYQPHSVTFEHAPDAHGRAISRMLGSGCLFRQPSNVYTLRRQHSVGEPQLEAAARLARLRAQLARRERDSDLAQRMRRAVFALIGSGEPVEQARVAARCAVSTRSLRRYLAAHGCSFRDELRRLRLEYAHSALTRSDLSIDEIARRLGYSAQSALTRAVRSELGLTPSQLRARAVSERQLGVAS